MAESATCRETVVAGVPATELTLACGDRLLVAQHGAQVLSWQAAGRERLYLSPHNAHNTHRVLAGQSAIRGGIPVCFPQFNQRGPLPKHGFARLLPWTPGAARCSANAAHLTLSLSDSPQTRQWWPQAFEALLLLSLTPGALHIALAVRNTDSQPLEFSGALHTYLAVDDVRQAQLQGLQGRPEWDAVSDQHGSGAATLRFAGEFDRVYSAPAQGCSLHDGPHTLRIEQDPQWAHTVVWNPGAEACAALPDMPADAWQHMLCVEAAQVYSPIRIAPGGFWQGGQRLSVQ